MSVQVDLWIGSYSAPRCVADVFADDVLTITSIDSDEALTTFPAGSWKRATVADDETGYPLYTLTAQTPPRTPLTHQQFADLKASA